jgi:serine/threonine protein kinase
MTNVFHVEYDRNQEDPYQSLRYLGSGGHGSVDAIFVKDDPTRTVYARKQARLVPHRRQQILDRMKEEARTMRYLQHRHIVKVVTTYTHLSLFGIIMSPAADTDFEHFLAEMDAMSVSRSRDQAKDCLLQWAGCLV